MIIPVGKSSYLECTLGRSVDSAFVITDKEKKASDIYKNILAYRKYFKNHSPIFLLPAKVDLLDVKSQIEVNRAYLSLLRRENPIFVLQKETLDVEVVVEDLFLESVIELSQGETFERERLIEKLYRAGYIALSNAKTSAEIDSIRDYLQEFYGGIPDMLESFINIRKLQKVAKDLGVSKVELKQNILKFIYEDINPELLVQLVKESNPLKVGSDQLIFYVETGKLREFIEEIENIAKRCKIDNRINI